MVVIEMENGKKIKIELYPEIAPITCANFEKLVKEGFYDGLIFHRVISGFMIQGGDPEGTGMGGAKENIKGEFAQNGVKNDLKHTRGVISMARSMMPDSASSQFFIMHKDAPHLDGGYAAVDRYDKAYALRLERVERGAVEPVALLEPRGDIAGHVAAPAAQIFRQQAGSRDAVDVVIAEDGDMLAALQGKPYARGGLVHVEQVERGGEGVAAG